MAPSFLKQIGYLGPYVRPHQRVLVLSLVLTVVSTALGLIQPYFAKVMIDRVFLAHNHRLLLPVLAVFILILAVGYLIRVSNGYLYTRYSARLLFRMREDLFGHLQRVPLVFFSRKKSGDIFSRLANDMSDVQALITETIPGYLFDFLTCLITLAILVYLNWRMALLNLFILPVGLVMVWKLQPKLLELSRKVAESNADIAHFLIESLGGVSLIRAFGAEALESGKLKEKHDSLLKTLLGFQILKAASGAVPTIFIIFNTLIVFGYGGLLVLKGELSLGALVAFSIYQGRVFAPLQGLMGGYLALQKARVSLVRVRELLDVAQADPPSGDYQPETGVLHGEFNLDDVSYAYNEEEPVLKKVSLRIPPGRTTAVVGSSGVGKSTICHLLLRLFDPDQGRITLDGIDLRQYKTDWLKRQMVLVAQDVFLFHTSILENIRYSKPEADEAEVIRAARAARIHDFVESLPQGYQTQVGDRGLRLSGGQKQRLNLARSILLDPQILILDEATAFLDPTVEEEIQETIRSLMTGRTVIVVSHHFSSIQGADKIIVLREDGSVLEGSGSDFIEQAARFFPWEPQAGREKGRAI